MGWGFYSPNYTFSFINHDMCSGTDEGYFNIMNNLAYASNMFESTRYWVPAVNMSSSIYPQYTMFDYLLDPRYSMWQVNMQQQNSFNNFSNMTSNWNNTSFPWVNWWNNNNNNNTSNESSECKALRALITKYKELGEKDSSLSPELLDKINTALNKTGTADEKYAALKEVYKELKPSKLQAAILGLSEYKAELEKAGYKFKASDDTKTMRTNLEKISSELNSGEWNTLAATYGANGSQGEILQIISLWNDTHTSDNDRSILRLCAKHISSEDTEKEVQRKIVRNLAESLINKATEFKVDCGTELPNLTNAVTALRNAVKDLGNSGSDYDKFSTANVNEAAKKFEALYAMLRLLEAEQIRNDIKTKYSFLNNISSTDTDFVNDDLVVKATEEDLKNEGISFSGIATDTIEIPEEDVDGGVDDPAIDITGTPQEQIEALSGNNVLKASAYSGVYQTDTEGSNVDPHFYTIKDGKMVELKGVKSIASDGKCTMLDGSTKPLSEVEGTDITASEISTYQKAAKKVESLISGGKIEKTSNKSPAGDTVYCSKGKDEDGNRQYFIIRNNEFVRIKGVVLEGCKEIALEKDDKVDTSKNKINFADIKDEHVEAISDNDILITNKKQEKENLKKQTKDLANKVAELNGLEKKCEKPPIYKSKIKKDGKYEYFAVIDGKIKKLNDVTNVKKDGSVRVNSEWVSLNDVQSTDMDESEFEKQYQIGFYNENYDDMSELKSGDKYAGLEDGKTVEESLSGSTSREESNKAKNIIDSMTTDNVYGILKGYDDKACYTFWFDNRLLKQIINEGSNTPAADKAFMINKIVETVIEFVQQNGVMGGDEAVSAYIELCNMFGDGFDEDNLPRAGECKTMDDYLYKIFNNFKEPNFKRS